MLRSASSIRCRMRANAASPPAIRSKVGLVVPGARFRRADGRATSGRALYRAGSAPATCANRAQPTARSTSPDLRRPLPVALEKRLLLVRIDRNPCCGRVAECPDEQHVEGVLAREEERRRRRARGSRRPGSSRGVCIRRAPRWVMYGIGSRFSSASAGMRNPPTGSAPGSSRRRTTTARTPSRRSR